VRVFTLTSRPTAAPWQRPNILFILADNLGYGDIGAYGRGELRGAPTPRLDQLAAVCHRDVWQVASRRPALQPTTKKASTNFMASRPTITWDAFLMIGQARQTKSMEIPLDKGPQIVEAKRGEPLNAVKADAAEPRPAYPAQGSSSSTVGQVTKVQFRP